MSSSIFSSKKCKLESGVIQLNKKQDYSSYGTGIDNFQPYKEFRWGLVLDGHGTINSPFFNKLWSLDFNNIVCNQNPINEIINELNNYKDYDVNTGTTLSLFKVYNNSIKIYNIGDSKTYVYINNDLIYSTTPHNMNNLNEELRLLDKVKVIRQNITKPMVISNDIIENIPSHAIIFNNLFALSMTQSLGHHNLIELDPEVVEIPYNSNDKIRIVCATDGLWDLFNEEIDKDDNLNMDINRLLNKYENRWKQEWILDGNIEIFNEYDDIGIVLYTYE